MDKWKTLGSKLIHENPHLNLTAYDVVRPNGVRAPFYVVERPRFAIIIPLTAAYETYLVGQYRYSMSYYSWELPMGAVKGKTFREMAAIELKEETGISAKQFTPIGSFHIAHGFLRQEATAFVAETLTVGQALPEENEFLQLKKIRIGQLGKMIAEGMIRDGPTICAYHLLEMYWKKRYRKNL